VCRWHPQPIKGNLAGIRGVLTELVLNPYHLITRAVGRYDKGADATFAGIRISDCEDDNRACLAPRGDELLGTVQHIAVTVAASPGAQRTGVGAGMRLGQGEGADLLAAGQRWQKTTLLFVASEPQDRRAPNRVVHAHDGRAGTVTSGNFFQRQG